MVESAVILVILLVVFLRWKKKYTLRKKNKSKRQAGRNKNKKVKGEAVDVSQNTNHSKLESSRSTQRTNKPNQANDEWKRRSNRRKSR